MAGLVPDCQHPEKYCVCIRQRSGRGNRGSGTHMADLSLPFTAARPAPRRASRWRVQPGTAPRPPAPANPAGTAPRARPPCSCATAGQAIPASAIPAGIADTRSDDPAGWCLPARRQPASWSWHWLHARFSWPNLVLNRTRPASKKGLGRAVDGHLERQAARLMRDGGGQRGHTLALRRQGGGALAFGAALVDALRQGDGAAQRWIELGVARGRAAHPGQGSVATGAASACRSRPVHPTASRPGGPTSMPGLAVSSSCSARVSGAASW